MSKSDSSLGFKFIISQVCGIGSAAAISQIPGGAPMWILLGTWAVVTVAVLLKA